MPQMSLHAGNTLPEKTIVYFISSLDRNKNPHQIRQQIIRSQPKFSATLYHKVFNFKGQTMIFIDSYDKYSLFYPIVMQFEANSCEVDIKILTATCYPIVLAR